MLIPKKGIFKGEEDLFKAFPSPSSALSASEPIPFGDEEPFEESFPPMEQGFGSFEPSFAEKAPTASDFDFASAFVSNSSEPAFFADFTGSVTTPTFEASFAEIGEPTYGGSSLSDEEPSYGGSSFSDEEPSYGGSSFSDEEDDSYGHGYNRTFGQEDNEEGFDGFGEYSWSGSSLEDSLKEESSDETACQFLLRSIEEGDSALEAIQSSLYLNRTKQLISMARKEKSNHSAIHLALLAGSVSWLSFALENVISLSPATSLSPHPMPRDARNPLIPTKTRVSTLLQPWGTEKPFSFSSLAGI